MRHEKNSKKLVRNFKNRFAHLHPKMCSGTTTDLMVDLDYVSCVEK